MWSKDSIVEIIYDYDKDKDKDKDEVKVNGEGAFGLDFDLTGDWVTDEFMLEKVWLSNLPLSRVFVFCLLLLLFGIPWRSEANSWISFDELFFEF